MLTKYNSGIIYCLDYIVNYALQDNGIIEKSRYQDIGMIQKSHDHLIQNSRQPGNIVFAVLYKTSNFCNIVTNYVSVRQIVYIILLTMHVKTTAS